ncbi:alpha-glucuronidase family glycosyl hydrolase [Sediminibacterium goheungense]|uniref:Xylan alpha-1,2-glucuronidase n=1 Tax=Sediminibacterium goheungense TaxID=1086393 RepID=A0A4R6IZT3_9BACT|nr:alpha-glucuronidase family glycosyl hydrolase [Sediminibacterium goheungense]TDO28434.1 alpha-glucuronidase [Sediminibacterium goheungense]
MKKICSLLLIIAVSFQLKAETGYDLWLRYQPLQNQTVLTTYRQQISGITLGGNAETMKIIGEELQHGLSAMLQKKITVTNKSSSTASLIAATGISPLLAGTEVKKLLAQTGEEGFIILSQNINGQKRIIISGNTDKAVLYGAFHFLRLIQTEQAIHNLQVVSVPKVKLRMLNHWDNMNRTVERGYAGFSLWNWHTLPGYIDPRYIDYARANASIGINGTVLTNVNANATILTKNYLEKVKALADAFRPYGIKVYLTARFSAPIEIGGLKTADPLDEKVRQWWKDKVKEIYQYVPDFGGFVVKANSEGQPGPQDYKRSHTDGANMLAEAVAPFNGIIMWRAFVYSAEKNVDRHKQAYDEFVPLDGSFNKNVMVQVKNGAIDFMPREPFHPLFGAMPKTPLMMEFQVTQEYLGQATNLVYLGPLFKECLEADTYTNGKGSTVAKVLDGSFNKAQTLTGITGVANIGNDINWCGHPFAQANWYAMGRLAWDHSLSAERIAEEWLRMTYSNHPAFLQTASKLMMESRETYVQYSNPIGLHHIMGTGHHYGPAPWVSNLNRPDWNPVYYHKADSIGIGFNRTATGSNALEQYHPEARKIWENMNTCEEKNLLWFHHVPWTFKMKSGRNLWDELCFNYYTGAEKVKTMQQAWAGLEPYVDKQRHDQVRMLLNVQYDEAIWWRNACLLYFQTFSKKPIPANYPQPDKTLEYYKSLRFPLAPGN